MQWVLAAWVHRALGRRQGLVPSDPAQALDLLCLTNRMQQGRCSGTSSVFRQKTACSFHVFCSEESCHGEKLGLAPGQRETRGAENGVCLLLVAD